MRRDPANLRHPPSPLRRRNLCSFMSSGRNDLSRPDGQSRSEIYGFQTTACGFGLWLLPSPADDLHLAETMLLWWTTVPWFWSVIAAVVPGAIGAIFVLSIIVLLTRS